MLKITLVAKPEVNGYQYKFEELLRDIGLFDGMFEINTKENDYCNENVILLWCRFKRKYQLS